MQVNPQHLDSSRYARCIEVSKRVRFEIERDVIRGRKLDFDGNLTAEQRDQGVDDLIALVGAVDGILQMQAKSDAAYFKGQTGKDIESTFLSAITAQQGERIGAALKPILG